MDQSRICKWSPRIQGLRDLVLHSHRMEKICDEIITNATENKGQLECHEYAFEEKGSGVTIVWKKQGSGKVSTLI